MWATPDPPSVAANVTDTGPVNQPEPHGLPLHAAVVAGAIVSMRIEDDPMPLRPPTESIAR